ncbi:MAG: DUF4123 domain-containing protein, partial [Desulfatitalea sp.]|nr:DUF4123 domain-containing protein [Desulfatitalea sp.]
MDIHALHKRLRGGPAAPDVGCYALVDCAAATDDTLYVHLSDPDTNKHPLLTGEPAWRNQRSAPYLVPLDDQPALAQWLLEKGWGRGWAVYLSTAADPKTLLTHLRRYFRIRTENGRNTYFRYFDPVILGPFLSDLSEAEQGAFFGPIHRFCFEDENGALQTHERPATQPPADGDAAPVTDPMSLIAARRPLLSGLWNRKLMAEHSATYQALGVAVSADAQTNRLTIREKDGTRATLQKTAAGVAVSTGQGRTFQYELSACKNPTAVIDPAGRRTEFDLQERENIVTRHKTSLLHAIRMENNHKRWVFDYDDSDHLIRIDYPDGTRAHIAHDSYGHLEAYTDRNCHTTTFERDHDERLVRMQDANGRNTRFEYDERMAPARIRFDDGTHFAFVYDNQDRLQTFLANDRKVADYPVDPDSGSWSAHYNDGTHAHFTVCDDRIASAANGAGTIEMTYDDAGHMLSERFNNRSVTYHRNPSGLLTGLTTPDGRTITYGRDGEQRVHTITDWRGRTIGLTYALGGTLESIRYPNGATLYQQNDPAGLPSRLTLTSVAAAEPLFDRRIRRDLLGRVRQIDDGPHTIAYHYDLEGRLTGVESDQADLRECFRLDPKANRLNDNSGPCAFNGADRIAQPDHAYDALGNLTRGPAATYRWQSANRLAEAATATTRAHYRYDAFGRRVEKRLAGVLTRYVWAGNQLLQEIIIGPDGDRTIDY